MSGNYTIPIHDPLGWILFSLHRTLFDGWMCFKKKKITHSCCSSSESLHPGSGDFKKVGASVFHNLAVLKTLPTTLPSYPD